MKAHSIHFLPFILLSVCIIGCDKYNSDISENKNISFTSHSKTPPFLIPLPGQEQLQVVTLISSEDSLPQSPAYVFGGTADGEGLIPSGDHNGYLLLVNHEDNWSVSRITLDSSFHPVHGEYVLNSTGGRARTCSATMATPGVHGFGPLFLSACESNVEAQIHGIDPFAAADPSTPKFLTGLGHWSAENAVPLPEACYPGRTVILIGEDATDSSGGQLAMYVSSTVGDLANGKLYALRRTNKDIRERDMVAGTAYDVEFIEIPNHLSMTGVQIQQSTMDSGAIRFAKLEDVDYRKGGLYFGRELYFNASGQSKTFDNADFSRTYKGRTYKLVLDNNNPLVGKLTCILDGDDATSAAYGLFQNPDNICVTQNYVYICEDPLGYGDETHESYIYRYSIAENKLTPVLTVSKIAAYNTNGASLTTKGNWEISGLIDISETIGVNNTFMTGVQSHTWIDLRFLNPDGGIYQTTEKQGSQVVIIKGLPR